MQLSPGALALLPQLNAFFGGAATVVADTATPCLVLAGGPALSEPVAIAKALALAASSAAAPLLGATPSAEAAVTQWLGWALSDAPRSPDALPALERALQATSYVAGHAFSVADAAVYLAMLPAVAAAGPGIARNRPVARWLRQLLAERPALVAASGAAKAPFVPPPAPVKWASTAAAAVAVVAPAAAAPAAAAAVAAAPTAAPAAAPVAAPAPAAATAAADAAAPDAAAADKLAKKAAEKEAKKAAAAAAAAAAPPPAAAPEDADPLSVCDVRVGVITKAWVHPTADKLYCEVRARGVLVRQACPASAPGCLARRRHVC
jgi:hypothetical protein